MTVWGALVGLRGAVRRATKATRERTKSVS